MYFDPNGLQTSTMADRIAGIPPGRDGSDYHLPNLSGSAGISLSVPAGFIQIGALRIPMAFNVSYKNSLETGHGSCTVRYGPGIGLNITARPNYTLSNQTGDDPSGLGFSESISIPSGYIPGVGFTGSKQIFERRIFRVSGTYRGWRYPFRWIRSKLYI